MSLLTPAFECLFDMFIGESTPGWRKWRCTGELDWSCWCLGPSSSAIQLSENDTDWCYNSRADLWTRQLRDRMPGTNKMCAFISLIAGQSTTTNEADWKHVGGGAGLITTAATIASVDLMLSGDETAVTYFGFPNSNWIQNAPEIQCYFSRFEDEARNFQNRDAVALILNIGSTCADNWR